MECRRYDTFSCDMRRTYGSSLRFGFIFTGLKSGVTIQTGVTPLKGCDSSLDFGCNCILILGCVYRYKRLATNPSLQTRGSHFKHKEHQGYTKDTKTNHSLRYLCGLCAFLCEPCG